MFKGLYILYSFIVLFFSNCFYSNNEALKCFYYPILQERPIFVQRPQDLTVAQYQQDDSRWDQVCCPMTLCCACACYHYPCAMVSCSVAGCCACAGYTGAKCMPVIISLLSDKVDFAPKKMQ